MVIKEIERDACADYLRGVSELGFCSGNEMYCKEGKGKRENRIDQKYTTHLSNISTNNRRFSQQPQSNIHPWMQIFPIHLREIFSRHATEFRG